MMMLFFILFGYAEAFMSVADNKSSINVDMETLLVIKNQISDPFGHLISWNETAPVCSWHGIACGRKHPERVVSLNIQSSNLSGTISPAVGNLSFLQILFLNDNSLYGVIPVAIGRLHRLQQLDLSSNSLHGEIPGTLSNCSMLLTVVLDSNLFTGPLPYELGSLQALEELVVANNSLSGFIPRSLANLSSLAVLSLQSNNLIGKIPTGFGNFASLQFFQVASNMFTGTLPSALFNATPLYFFSATSNQLHGVLPSDTGITLPNLQSLLLGSNQLGGFIPTTLPNASKLVEIDLSRNNFVGQVPPSMGRLQNLQDLNLEGNQLGVNAADDLLFLDSLTNCSELESLAIDHNNLQGVLPASISNLSTSLQYLYLNWNLISGSIPYGIGNLVNLITFSVGNNSLTGEIPESIGKLSKLERGLGLYQNEFTGKIPKSVSNLTRLNYLMLYENRLNGSIPSSIGKLQQLTILDLSNNLLTGEIPMEIFTLSYLSKGIYLSKNLLSGVLQDDVGRLQNIRNFAVSENRLTGRIPNALGNCQVMEKLALDNNFFNGSIPASLSNLKGLKVMDLSLNNLSGSIPMSLQDLNSLDYLNLSFNNLEGEVPTKGVFRNVTAVSLSGNEGLCGGLSALNLVACPTDSSGDQRKRSKWWHVMLPILGVLLISIAMILFFYQKGKYRKQPDHVQSDLLSDSYPRISYLALVKATDNFSVGNLIGTGRYSWVYKGSLDDGMTMVAVKVFNLQVPGATKSFTDECEVLSSTRHRNIIRILTACTSIDSSGNDFRALVLEFMPNGSLEEWLHPTKQIKLDDNSVLKSLSLVQRVNIAIDVADALEYLHHSYQIPIVHGDIKPGNILLDHDMSARVADFGLAKFISAENNTNSLQDTFASVAIRGSIGYVAPEYGAGGEVSVNGDVYSYGILILEMFTHRRPVDEAFKDGLNLHDFVQRSIPEHVMEILDPVIHLHEEHNKDEQMIMTSRINDCIVSVLHVGLLCSNQSPNERMSMRRVAAELRAIRDSSSLQ